MVTSMPYSPKIRVLLGTLQALVAAALLVLVMGLLAGTLPSLFDYESYVVRSGSMEPVISVGDLSVTAPSRPSELMVGDIIVYRTAENPAVVVTQRLVGIELDEAGTLAFQTRGDANNTVDRVLVSEEALMGRVMYTIPMLGYVANFAKQPEGRLLLIVIPAVLLALDYLVGARRRSRAEAQPASTEASELVAQGQSALHTGAAGEALALVDRAIALDPRLEAAWLLKAEAITGSTERIACLRFGLTINPDSARLQEALARMSTVPAAAS